MIPSPRDVLRLRLRCSLPASGWGIVAVLALASCGAPPSPAPPTPPDEVVPSDPALRIEWPSYGGDPGGLKYSRAAEIRPDNVSNLQPLWTWRLAEPARFSDAGIEVRAGALEVTPLMVGDTLFLSTPFSGAVALDALTGAEFWRFESEAWRWRNLERSTRWVSRGVALWSSPEARRVLLHSRWRLFALDAATGRPIPSFGHNGVVDLSQGFRWPVDSLELSGTSPPAIYRDIVIVGSSISDHLVYPRNPPGDVQAFDVRTGKPLWRWNPVPLEGEPGSETWDARGRETVGHVNTWAPMTVDTARGLVYLPVSTPSNDWYGGGRLGDGLYGESLVCLDANTGKMVWFKQLVHHGIWDYDPAAPPNLVTVVQDGRPRDLVTLPGKTGFLYVFDRVTGEPIWPIEERPVPASDVPGEQASPTQPFPTWPAPFARQGFTEDDLVDFTPEIRRMAAERIRGFRTGPIFTPPSLEGTVVLPGFIGGSGWGGGAIDPEAGVIYIKATNQPVLGRVAPAVGEDGNSEVGYTLDFSIGPVAPVSIELPTARSWRPPFRRAAVTMPIIRPPWGTLTAIDLATGEHRWQVPLGDMPELRNVPALRKLGLPRLGTPGPVGGVATAGGLIFITGGGATLYAIDARDGSVQWEWDLGVDAKSNPMTYRTAEGRQIVVVAVGRGGNSILQAFALPR